MAKRTTQTPTEENLENVQESTGGENVSQEVEQTADNGIRCVATPDNDGVALIDGDGQTLLIVDLNESQQAFGGDESQDLEDDVASPSMTGLDGQQRSAFLLDFYGREEKKVPALDACAEFGWLPSGGEMALIFANKTAINEMIESLGGTPIGDGRYWTSQRFSNERMWSINMSDGTFGIALGTASVAGVRAVKKESLTIKKNTTMADFDLTQTDAQVQSILNDAQDAQGAGAQTTLTTEYIMLKDTSGNYHKILKSSFTEACRNVLAGLLVNNDKGTTISQIAAIASGDFGSVTPANLASVLGAIELKEAFAGSNLYTKIFAFTLSDASGECSQLDIVHYDANGTYGAFTIFYSKWNTNSYCVYGCHQYSIVKRKGNVIYLGFSGGSGYGMVKYNVMGNQSVTVSEVSSIPSDAIDVNFPGDFPAFYKNYNSLAELKEALAAV